MVLGSLMSSGNIITMVVSQTYDIGSSKSSNDGKWNVGRAFTEDIYESMGI